MEITSFVNTHGIDIIGYSAGFLTTFASLPQIIKTIYTRETQNISILALVSIWSGLLLWVIYGILLVNWVLLISNSVALIQYSFLIILKFVFDRRRRDTKKIPIFMESTPLTTAKA